jgi:hypothetical protein
MPDVARDPAPLDLLRLQRTRLADRFRAPWWYLAGVALLWAMVFAGPFASRYLPHGFRLWPILIVGGALALLLQWRMTSVTGIKTGFRNLSYRPGRPAGITMLVVGLGGAGLERFLIDRDLIALAVVVGVLGVAAQVAAQLAMLRAIRRALRAGGGLG